MSVEYYSIILALLAALIAGLVGSFALMRRMALAGDVISHVALPGLGIALLMNANPLLGAAASLFIGTLIIWELERRTGLAVETTIGVVFAGSLALGVLLTPSEELIEALFGEFGTLTATEFAIGTAVSLLIITLIIKFRNQLVIWLFSSELAKATGIKTHRLNLIFLLTFSATVLLGLRFLGALLMGALIIIPAAVGRQLTHTLGSFLVVSSVVSILSVALGLFVAHYYRFPSEHTGALIITIAAGLFVFSLLKKKQ